MICQLLLAAISPTSVGCPSGYLTKVTSHTRLSRDEVRELKFFLPKRPYSPQAKVHSELSSLTSDQVCESMVRSHVNPWILSSKSIKQLSTQPHLTPKLCIIRTQALFTKGPHLDVTSTHIISRRKHYKRTLRRCFTRAIHTLCCSLREIWTGKWRPRNFMALMSRRPCHHALTTM